MAEMKNRLEDVKLFLDVIREHVSYHVAIIARKDDLERAKKRIWSDNLALAFGACARYSKFDGKVFCVAVLRGSYWRSS
jgi:hypothetical protein